MTLPSPEPEPVFGFPIVICPHLPPDTIYLMHDPPPCPLCLADAVAEAERIVNESDPT